MRLLTNTPILPLTSLKLNHNEFFIGVINCAVISIISGNHFFCNSFVMF